MQSMKDRSIIVTGAASGIGKATALKLAEMGANVVAADINEDGARQVATQAAAHGIKCVPSHTDMSNSDDIAKMVEQTVNQFGRIDGLVNNAADIGLTRYDSNVVDTEMTVWDRVYQVNFRGPVLACKLAIPHMLKAGGGSIVNVSSIQSLLGDHERVAYSAMKSAMNSLTRSIATTYGKQGIRCNTVCPGPVMSREPEKRWPEKLVEDFRSHILLEDVSSPEEQSELIAFLLSESAASVTGQTIASDMGYSSHMHFYMRAAIPPDKA